MTATTSSPTSPAPTSSKGGPGNDAIDAGPGHDILMGGDGNDFTNGGANDNETFAGAGNDFVIAGQGADAVFGDGGDDWIEGGTGQDLLQGDHGAPFFDDPARPRRATTSSSVRSARTTTTPRVATTSCRRTPRSTATPVPAGSTGPSTSTTRSGADDDMAINNFLAGVPIQVVVNRDRWQETEADSGSAFNDVIRGTDDAPADVGGAGFTGCDALDQAGIDRIAGLTRDHAGR